MRVDFASSLDHYADHLQPIWEVLPVETRGTWWGWPARHVAFLRRRGIAAAMAQRIRGSGRLVVSAGYVDLRRAPGHRLVLVEHGAGQSYDADDPGWSGGSKREGVGLFIVPNEVAAARNSARYPSIPNVVVGSPRVDALRGLRTMDHGPCTVVLSFHWPGNGKVAEAGWALPHYEDALSDIIAKLQADGFDVVGHGHPRAERHFARLWRRLGVEHVKNFDDVVRRATVYVADNSSTLFEAAACDIPVVVLNAPWYRRDIDLWPRFWRCADVGVRVDEPDDLAPAVRLALNDPPLVRARRREIVSEIYGPLDGRAARRAAAAILALR